MGDAPDESRGPYRGSIRTARNRRRSIETDSPEGGASADSTRSELGNTRCGGTLDGLDFHTEEFPCEAPRVDLGSSDAFVE